MKKIKNIALIVLLGGLVPTVSFAQYYSYPANESMTVNNTIRMSNANSATAPKIMLPPGVKMYTPDFFQINDSMEDMELEENIESGNEQDNEVIVPVITETSNVLPNNVLNNMPDNTINTLNLSNDMVPLNMNALNMPQYNNQSYPVQNQNYDAPKNVGQVSIKPVIIPLGSISSFNKTTIEEYSEIGNKRLEESYRSFLLK